MKMVFFYAPWCTPCKAVRPVINNLSNRFDVQEVDCDRQPVPAKEHNVTSIPTLLIVEGNLITSRLVGSAEITLDRVEQCLREAGV